MGAPRAWVESGPAPQGSACPPGRSACGAVSLCTNGMERYEKVRVLARGSYGTAILARIRETRSANLAGSRGPPPDMLRVIKEVDFNEANEKARAEALREAEMLKSLSHPNIVGYEDAFYSVEGNLCIVMEYADGGDLGAAIAEMKAANRRYHEREAMSLFVQLAIALEYIHERRILHRDLKSQNVFLTRAGVAKLGDFGIAKVVEASDGYARTQIGTPYYLAPEMCNNKPYCFKADVWGIGIVLYELLALEVPFSAPNMAALALKICTQEPRPVPAVYSNEVRTLLGRMLAKRPEDRPSSADIVALPHVRRGIAALLSCIPRPPPAAVAPVAAAPRTPDQADTKAKAVPALPVLAELPELLPHIEGSKSSSYSFDDTPTAAAAAQKALTDGLDELRAAGFLAEVRELDLSPGGPNSLERQETDPWWADAQALGFESLSLAQASDPFGLGQPRSAGVGAAAVARSPCLQDARRPCTDETLSALLSGYGPSSPPMVGHSVAVSPEKKDPGQCTPSILLSPYIEHCAPLSPQDVGQVALLENSLRQALERTSSCESLLHELEREFNLDLA
eukprot:gnl/TRDRNA2_/TRDRNA2_182634_c0_seq1.p1 gnl/TRDRNA2_/TRDRNA2_182634_c0~~gnl/TRDRNA2_/TRDRNA2_182634_c0_seq1.p1  ORF type:complete len:568 (+),score=103.19 gnl/TRDRNA2_/TRDRNA2_182634_c0_seq1:87-1790(+)